MAVRSQGSCGSLILIMYIEYPPSLPVISDSVCEGESKQRERVEHSIAVPAP